MCSYDKTHELIARWSSARPQYAPRWTPDGSRIVFGRDARIYVIDAEGSRLESLSGSVEPVRWNEDTFDLDFSPAMSPDGLKVAYTTLRHGIGPPWDRKRSYEIVTASLDGSDHRRITKNEWDDISPVWSPDGTRIAFVSYRNDDAQIYTMASDGSDQRSVATSVDVSPQPPAWSPDSSRLAFLAQEVEKATIPYLDPYDSRVTPTAGTYDGAIVRHVAYTVRVDGSDLTKLEWIDDRSSSPRTRSELRDVSSPEETVSLPAWSPDGQRLAFSAAFYGELPTIYSIGVDGSELRSIFTPPNVENFYRSRFRSIFNISWTSDGSGIQFMGAGAVPVSVDSIRNIIGAYVADVDGSGLKMSSEVVENIGLINSDNTLVWPDWTLTWSPDGTRVAVHNPDKNFAIVLYTIALDGTDKRALVRQDAARLSAENSGEFGGKDVATDIAACSKGVVIPNPRENAGLVQDCETLMKIRNILGGDAKINWRTDKFIAEWDWITVQGTRAHGAKPRVQRLSVRIHEDGFQGRLNGTIPPELGNLEELRELHLHGNTLSGSIPSELGNLKKLKELNLSGNNLTGTIPPELGKLIRLQGLHLHNNDLTGFIPPELGKLTRLQGLYLQNNDLTGIIPAALSDMEKLGSLDVRGNLMIGCVPSKLAANTQVDSDGLPSCGKYIPQLDNNKIPSVESLAPGEPQ